MLYPHINISLSIYLKSYNAYKLSSWNSPPTLLKCCTILILWDNHNQPWLWLFPTYKWDQLNWFNLESKSSSTQKKIWLGQTNLNIRRKLLSWALLVPTCCTYAYKLLCQTIPKQSTKLGHVDGCPFGKFKLVTMSSLIHSHRSSFLETLFFLQA